MRVIIQNTAFFLLLIISTAYGQTAGRNYIIETVVKDPGYTTIASLKNLPIDNVIRTVQYIDGLGRPAQKVVWKGSPLQKDIVQVMEYDPFGREAKSYLPYAEQASSDGSYKVNGFVNQANYYGASTWDSRIVKTSKPFSLTVFENSPLNRVLEQGFEGEVWQPVTGSSSGRTQKMDYGTNVTNEVKQWAVTINGASASYYQPGKLYKTIVKDENWNLSLNIKAGTIEEFKDFKDRLVLKRIWESETKSLSTYYLYDELGDLRYVLPPEVNENGSSTINNFTENDLIFKHYIYGYHYDGRRRIIEKKIPGKDEWEYLVYNKLDQLVATQDGNQRNQHQWFVTKYDAHGRTVQTGTWNNGTIAIGRASLQSLVNTQAGSNQWEERTDGDYSNRAWPTSGVDPLQVNYYDNYTVVGIPHNESISYTQLLKGLPTASKTRILGTTNYLWTVSYYDDKAQVVRQYSQHYKGGMVSVNNYDDIINDYNFTGQIKKSTRNHFAGSTTPTVSVITEYTYDHQLRLEDIWKTVNTGARTLIARNEYNEIGQLVNKKLHSINDGATFLTATSFTYNPRGWLKKQVNPLFNMELKYEDGTNPQYNGNISHQYWGPGSTPNLHNYSYLYDKLNRLTSGISDEGFNETISYDVMGNIKTMNRNPMGTNTYTYSGNRLSSISGFVNGSYGYDANGNQTSDNTKGITIAYNQLNLPQTITKASSSEIMTNTWLANGAKLSKVVAGITRDYVNGIEYNGNDIEMIHMEEGRMIPTGGTSYAYQYFLKDHLGNTRVFMDSDGTAKESSDYYPFGLQVARSGHTSPSPENRYKYNGKELQTEMGLGQYDYGARFYDPVIGRWNVVDPMAEIYQSYSPYNYTVNNPIRFIDPNGMWVEPTDEEAARMAKHVYGDKVKLIGGWMVSQAMGHLNYNDKDGTGFKSGLYERTVDGVTEYTYATAGTEDFFGKDGKANIAQLVGKSGQYDQSTSIAGRLKEGLNNAELTFTGHSLGGGLAEANSIATGLKGITFNAVGLSAFTKDVNSSKSNVAAYVMTTDPLNALQLHPSLPRAGGTRHYLQPRSLSGVYNGHSIDSIIEALQKISPTSDFRNRILQAITPRF